MLHRADDSCGMDSENATQLRLGWLDRLSERLSDWIGEREGMNGKARAQIAIDQ